MSKTYWLETLGCPKNQVDSDKLEGTLVNEGMAEAKSPEKADLIVVNSCAFIEDSRIETLEISKELSERRKKGAKLVVTGCMAERYGEQIDLKDVDAVAGFGVPVHLSNAPSFDLLNLPRPKAKAPWAYLKIAEGCDRKCGYCAIPSFRGPQRSRTQSDILEELDQLDVKEIVLVAQDLAAYMKDKSDKSSRANAGQPILDLLPAVAKKVDWVRLLYLYPSDLSQDLVDAILDTQVPYFDLSLQHASRQLLRKMRRFGSAEIFLTQISKIRSQAPEAVFRSNFIVGYPGETEEDHQELLDFLEQAQLDWGVFFLYSQEAGTHSESLPDKVPVGLARERRAELQSLQLEITESARDSLVGTTTTVLVEATGESRSYREAPEIDGIIFVPEALSVGEFREVKITGASGCDLHAQLL